MPLKPELIITKDGSHTLCLNDGQVTYHSGHGALQESDHIYIRSGWKYALEKFPVKELRIFEMGFGTGLNVLLTAKEAALQQRKVHYHSMDLFPLPRACWQSLNYGALVEEEQLWREICLAGWNETHLISSFFTLKKEAHDFVSATLKGSYHLIYFDAFSPEVNPELWTESIFEKLIRHTVPGGVLVTYCSKSLIRKAMQRAGWLVEKLPGPWGKREIVRAASSPYPFSKGEDGLLPE